MVDFFQDNLSAIAGIVTMAIVWFALNLKSPSNSVESIDKSRATNDLPPMTDVEKLIIKKVLRQSSINDSIAAIVSGIAALIATSILQNLGG